MNEKKVASVLLGFAVGDKQKEEWFLEKGLTKSDLEEAVRMQYLTKYEKDENDLMSDTGYILTRKGRDFVWNQETK